MSKNLVLCCDGTNNEFGPENTNVVRLIQVLDRDPNRQRLYYDPGVGTLPEPGFVTWLGKKISDMSGLAFGAGLSWKVQEAYGYLMEQWEPGDRVFVFGFSRGAYTARVLAGMLHAFGLLSPGNENLVPYVMRLYKSARKERQKSSGALGRWQKLCDEFRWTFARTIFTGDDERRFPVHFLGVWDTVSSVGWVWDPDKFPYTARNPSVETIRHAVSVDERRWFFRQNLMKKASGYVTAQRKEQDLKEFWFAGVHSDVGGGYPEIFSEKPRVTYSGLWRVPFEWMVTEARNAGLSVVDERLGKVLQRTPPCEFPWDEQQHESLTRGWWPAEFVPKRVWRSDLQRMQWQMGLGRHRHIPDNALIHRSTLLRMRETGYAPPNISKSFRERILELSGEIPETLPLS